MKRISSYFKFTVKLMLYMLMGLRGTDTDYIEEF